MRTCMRTCQASAGDQRVGGFSSFNEQRIASTIPLPPAFPSKEPFFLHIPTPNVLSHPAEPAIEIAEIARHLPHQILQQHSKPVRNTPNMTCEKKNSLARHFHQLTIPIFHHAGSGTSSSSSSSWAGPASPSTSCAAMASSGPWRTPTSSCASARTSSSWRCRR